jgi:hypothetical protein
MLCGVRFTTVDPKENFGKYAMHVTESETGRVWREIRFHDENMLASVMANIGVSEGQQDIFYMDLARHSETGIGEFDIEDGYAMMLRD